MGPHHSYDSSAANIGSFAAAGYSGSSGIGNYHQNHMVQSSGNVSGGASSNVPGSHPGSNAMNRPDNHRPNSAVQNLSQQDIYLPHDYMQPFIQSNPSGVMPQN